MLPEVGSRRRRREIREARERARAAERERQSAVRRLSRSSTASPAPDLFDQESSQTQVPPAVRREREGSDNGRPQNPSPQRPSGETLPHQTLPNQALPTPVESRRSRRQRRSATESAAESGASPAVPGETAQGQPASSRSAQARHQGGTGAQSTSSQPATDQPTPDRAGQKSRGPAAGSTPARRTERQVPDRRSPGTQTPRAQQTPRIDQAPGNQAPRNEEPTRIQPAVSPAAGSHQRDSTPPGEALHHESTPTEALGGAPAGKGRESSSVQTPPPVRSEDHPSPVPGRARPTAFDELVTGSAASSAEAAGSEEPAGEQDISAEEFDAFDADEGAFDDDTSASFDDFEDLEHIDLDEIDGHIEHDEDGHPVLVSASGFGRGYQTVQPLTGRMARNILQQRKAKRRRRNITLTLAIGGFVVMVAVVWIFLQSIAGIFGPREAEDYEEQAGEFVQFQVVEGDGIESVATRLADAEIIASTEAFSEAVQELEAEGERGELHPGTYELREQMPAADAAEELLSEGGQFWYIGITPDMWNDDVIETLAENTAHSYEEYQQLNRNPQRFGLPEQAENLEGYIAAGEYQPEAGTSAEEIIEMMIEPTFELLEAEGVDDPDEQYRAITIASLITAEGLPEDYPRIAGAIENRLQDEDGETNGYLQIDAAVNYGRGVRGTHFTEEERFDASNEYNTYVHSGLPPGPIGAPDQRAVTAAADPEDNDYLFWVTVDLHTGETRFAETFAEHEENVELLNQFCEENEETCNQEVGGGQTETEQPGGQ